MPKRSLSKGIEAKKLNRRTGVPTTDPAVAIPFGAVIDNIEVDGDMRRFTYSGELYRCPEDILASALDKEAASQPASAPAGAPPKPAAHAAGPAPTPEPATKSDLLWEELASSHAPLLRAKVPGGWLLSSGAGGGLAFYPDPGHAWDGASLP